MNKLNDQQAIELLRYRGFKVNDDKRRNSTGFNVIDNRISSFPNGKGKQENDKEIITKNIAKAYGKLAVDMTKSTGIGFSKTINYPAHRMIKYAEKNPQKTKNLVSKMVNPIPYSNYKM